MDRGGLADFLRRRREALQPEDVGLPRGQRRRTSGLRREEVSMLCGMSTDYYSRLERQRGPQPSEQMVGAMARGLRLTLDERDHLFVLAGHNAPVRAPHGDHVSPGLLRILDRLDDTPALVVNPLGETLRMTRLGVALLGDQTRFTGMARSICYRWFTDPAERSLYPAEAHAMQARVLTSGLRAVATREGPGSRAAALVAALLEVSEEFAARWADHEVGVRHQTQKALVHPRVGALTLHCQTLLDPDQAQSLLVYTATPGSVSADRFRSLALAMSGTAGAPGTAEAEGAGAEGAAGLAGLAAGSAG